MFEHPIIFIALASVACFVVGMLLFKADEAIEDRRRNAIDGYVDAEKYGLDFLKPALKDYAVGDYSALLSRIRGVMHDLRDDTKRAQILDHIFKVQMYLRLEKPETAQFVEDAVKTVVQRHPELFKKVLARLKVTEPGFADALVNAVDDDIPPANA